MPISVARHWPRLLWGFSEAISQGEELCPWSRGWTGHISWLHHRGWGCRAGLQAGGLLDHHLGAPRGAHGLGEPKGTWEGGV